MVDKKKPKGKKQRAAEFLKEVGFIDEDFNGKVVLEMDINQGGVRSLDFNKIQRIE